MERKYFEIDERTARTANDINSFSTYTPGSAKAAYIKECDAVYDIADRIEAERPKQAERAAYMAERYAKKYADYLNAYYRNEASCPSVLICGAGNFPTAKKNKQNARRETLLKQYNGLQEYRRKIKNILSEKEVIYSGEADALERLKDKLADLEEEHEKMKRANAYYRKNKTLVGCDDFGEETAAKITLIMEQHAWYNAPFPPFKLQNSNAEINRIKGRIADLERAKETGNAETEYDGFTVKENADIMRLQIFFPGKPDEKTRSILKSNGFKWAPSQNAWQRQLTLNAKYALKRVISDLQ